MMLTPTGYPPTVTKGSELSSMTIRVTGWKSKSKTVAKSG